MTEQMTSTNQSAQFQFFFRALFCFAAAGTLLAGIRVETIEPVFLGMVTLLFLYAYIVYLISKIIPEEHSQATARWAHYGDAILIGGVIVLSNFNLLSSVLFITMVQFNALMNGGPSRLVSDNIALILGLIVAVFLYQPESIIHTQVEIHLASVIGITTYFCASAVYAFGQITELKKTNESLESEKQQYKTRAYKLSRYLPAPVWNAINQNDESQKTERKRLTVFFSDIKEFSELSEELEAETLTDVLNTYLTEMARIVTQYGGSIDKFMGDGMMVIFGDHNSKGLKADALRCVSMAIAMRRRMKVLQQQWYNQGIKRPMQIRMGINTGYCTVGTFGTSHHLDYTVLGTHVNLASRLESAAEPGEILISHETCALVKDSVMARDKGKINVKGFSHPVKVFEVVDLRKDMDKNQSYFEHNLNGFAMHMDLDNVRNYDRPRVIESLNSAIEALEKKDV